MPTAQRSCSVFGCGGATPCPTHPPRPRHPRRSRVEQQQYDRQRGSASARGYDTAWRRARLAYLAKHPLCVECQRKGFITAASVVDHIQPHEGDRTLFWQSDNWAALCAPCHNRKTWSGQ